MLNDMQKQPTENQNTVGNEVNRIKLIEHR